LGAIETLKRCEVFLGLDNTDLQKIADLPSCQEQIYQAQEVIFESCGEARSFYVVEEGYVNLVVRESALLPHMPKQNVVRTVAKGGTFGWSAVIPPHVHILRAIARNPSKVLAVNGKELLALFNQQPYLGYEVMKGLLQVIATSFRNIEHLLVTGKGSPFYERQKTEKTQTG
jgi:CRP-like cAMP-binding protein